MSYSGSIVEYGGKVLYVFGTAEVVSWSADFPDKYHIGINLDTGKVDDIKGTVHELRFHQLTDEQQSILGVHIPVYHKLKKNVISVSAKARSGKDTLADYVRSVIRREPGIEMIALGDAIRDVRNVLYGVPKGKDRAPLIMIGQGLRREDPNVWIKVWLARVIGRVQKGKADRFICQDVRQPNEFSFFTSLGALTVKVVADEEKRLNKIREIDGEAALDAKLLNDETESHVGGFDAEITVENNYDEFYVKEVDSKVVTALIERGW